MQSQNGDNAANLQRVRYATWLNGGFAADGGFAERTAGPSLAARPLDGPPSTRLSGGLGCRSGDSLDASGP
jgi:hypothetical protein